MSTDFAWLNSRMPAGPGQQAEGAAALSAAAADGAPGDGAPGEGATAAPVEIRAVTPADHDAVVDLWERGGLTRPWIDARSELDLKVATDPGGLLVAVVDGALVGTVMVGFEGHRGWVNYLAVEPERRRSGIARALMAAGEAHLRALGAPKVNLQVRRTNTEVLGFYRALGYVDDDVVSLGRRLD